jgi:hypothetical protein
MLERSSVVKEVDSGHKVEIPEMFEGSRVAQQVLDSQPLSLLSSSRGAIHFLRNIHTHDSRSSTPPELVRVVSRATGEIEHGQTRDVTEDLKHGWKLDKAAEGYQVNDSSYRATVASYWSRIFVLLMSDPHAPMKRETAPRSVTEKRTR